MTGSYKHLIILVDGTWNSAARGTYKDITNIFRLNHVFDTDDKNKNPQITFYIPGPGTRGWTDKKLGGAFGIGIDEIIKEAYVNLASNYDEAGGEKESDKIYLFGFSRGAIVARALSGLISKCGLLYPRSVDRFWQVWENFISPHPHPEFKEDIAPYINDNVKIEMVGVFDTVLGRSYSHDNFVTKIRFKDYNLEPLVKTGVQILSMDDNRRRFLPIIWDRYNSGQNGGSPSDGDIQTIKQIWMPGVHADIGGILPARGMNVRSNVLSDVSFLTMVEAIKKHTALSVDDDYVNEIVGEIEYANSIGISNERATPVMKAFGYRNRKSALSIFSDGRNVGEFLHPVYDFLCGREINVKGRRGVYHNAHFEGVKDRMHRYQTPLQDFYADQCSRIINEMH